MRPMTVAAKLRHGGKKHHRVHGAAISFGALAATVAIGAVWRPELDLTSFILLFVSYSGTVLGITLGFHRLASHHSFGAHPVVRGALWVLGSMATQGPLIYWVSNHRCHHRYSDMPGDPHSPHVGHAGETLNPWRGWFHAHVGWIFGDSVSDPLLYARDLYRDPVARWVNRTYVLWVIAGLALPWALGALGTGTAAGGHRALYWAGVVRLTLSFNLTGAINSLSHMWGPRTFATNDESRNLAILALPTFGDAWHNNHHAFPWSARHGLQPHEIDLGWLLLRLLASMGCVYDLKIPTERDHARFTARNNKRNAHDIEERH